MTQNWGRGGGWWRVGGGGKQWNPEDEVTYMPRVIRRLWLLHLCELVDFEALLTASPTSSLAIYSTTQHNK